MHSAHMHKHRRRHAPQAAGHAASSRQSHLAQANEWFHKTSAQCASSTYHPSCIMHHASAAVGAGATGNTASRQAGKSQPPAAERPSRTARTPETQLKQPKLQRKVKIRMLRTIRTTSHVAAPRSSSSDGRSEWALGRDSASVPPSLRPPTLWPYLKISTFKLKVDRC